MKIRNRLLLNILGTIGSVTVRIWYKTLRLEMYFAQPEDNPLSADCDNNHVIVVWHENLLLAADLLSKIHQYTIVSKSDDGEYITQIVERMGLRVIRGSSSRGAVQAVRKLVRLAVTQRIHIGVTADGPRGPRREMKPGAVYLAAKAGKTLLPIGAAYDRPWRANSWDRFAMPRPFSRVVLVAGKPISFDSDIDKDELERQRILVQERMAQVQAEAERRISGQAEQPSPLPKAA